MGRDEVEVLRATIAPRVLMIRETGRDGVYKHFY